MKRTFAVTICLALVTPILAFGQEDDKTEKEEERAARKAAKAERKAERQEQKERRDDRPDRRSVDVQPAPNVQQPAPVAQQPAPVVQQTAETQPAAAPRMQTQVQQQQPVSAPRYTAEVQPAAAPQVNAQVNTEVVRRDIRSRNLDRRGPRAHSWSYDEARRYHRRDRRDRGWWRSNYSRFALFGGGYYYWDRGYWYPAYGYDPAYSTYRYDEPIYGYNQMEPGRVLVNVQRELRRMGYYRGAIDGLIGPMTRSALTRFQRDNGLRATSRIDGPTLAALGVV